MSHPERSEGSPCGGCKDLDARLVERWRPNDSRPEVLDHDMAWRPSPEVPALRVDLHRCFVEVMDGT